MKLVGRYLRIGQTLFDKFAKEWGQVYADQLDIRLVCKRIIPDFIVECGRTAIVDDITAFAMLQIVDHNLKFCTSIAAKLIKRNDGTQGRLGHCIFLRSTHGTRKVTHDRCCRNTMSMRNE